MNENDIDRTLNSDTLLREAISHREQKRPSMPVDLNKRLMQRMGQDGKSNHRIKLYVTSAIAIAAGILLFLMTHNCHVEQKGQPVAVQQEMPSKHQRNWAHDSSHGLNQEVAPPIPAMHVIHKPQKKQHKSIVTKHPLAQEPIAIEVITADTPAVFQAKEIRSRGQRLYQQIAQMYHD